MNYHVLVPLVIILLAIPATRNLWAIGLIAFSYATTLLVIQFAHTGTATFLYAAGGAAVLFTGFFIAARKTGVFQLDGDIELKIWRMAARPFAFLFMPVGLLFGNRTLLVLIGSVALVFIVTDLVRIFSTIHSDRIYKKGERKKFSSMTAFLVSLFAVFLLFPSPISYLALGFVTLGDLYSKLIGIRFGKTRIFERRTLEGSLAFVTGSLVAGHIISFFVPVPPVYIFVGAFCAAAVELFSRDLDDNLTVGIISGLFLTVLKYFFHI